MTTGMQLHHPGWTTHGPQRDGGALRPTLPLRRPCEGQGSWGPFHDYMGRQPHSTLGAVPGQQS